MLRVEKSRTILKMSKKDLEVITDFYNTLCYTEPFDDLSTSDAWDFLGWLAAGDKNMGYAFSSEYGDRQHLVDVVIDKED